MARKRACRPTRKSSGGNCVQRISAAEPLPYREHPPDLQVRIVQSSGLAVSIHTAMDTRFIVPGQRDCSSMSEPETRRSISDASIGGPKR
jgi:hypothetical protein